MFLGLIAFFSVGSFYCRVHILENNHYFLAKNLRIEASHLRNSVSYQKKTCSWMLGLHKNSTFLSFELCCVGRGSHQLRDRVGWHDHGLVNTELMLK